MSSDEDKLVSEKMANKSIFFLQFGHLHSHDHRSIGVFPPVDPIELEREGWRIVKGLVVEESAYLRAGAVKSGCEVNCVGDDGGGRSTAEIDDASASADA